METNLNIQTEYKAPADSIDLGTFDDGEIRAIYSPSNLLLVLTDADSGFEIENRKGYTTEDQARAAVAKMLAHDGPTTVSV